MKYIIWISTVLIFIGIQSLRADDQISSAKIPAISLSK